MRILFYSMFCIKIITGKIELTVIKNKHIITNDVVFFFTCNFFTTSMAWVVFYSLFSHANIDLPNRCF